MAFFPEPLTVAMWVISVATLSVNWRLPDSQMVEVVRPPTQALLGPSLASLTTAISTTASSDAFGSVPSLDSPWAAVWTALTIAFTSTFASAITACTRPGVLVPAALLVFLALCFVVAREIEAMINILQVADDGEDQERLLGLHFALEAQLTERDLMIKALRVQEDANLAALDAKHRRILAFWAWTWVQTEHLRREWCKRALLYQAMWHQSSKRAASLIARDGETIRDLKINQALAWMDEDRLNARIETLEQDLETFRSNAKEISASLEAKDKETAALLEVKDKETAALLESKSQEITPLLAAKDDETAAALGSKDQEIANLLAAKDQELADLLDYKDKEIDTLLGAKDYETALLLGSKDQEVATLLAAKDQEIAAFQTAKEETAAVLASKNREIANLLAAPWRDQEVEALRAAKEEYEERIAGLWEEIRGQQWDSGTKAKENAELAARCTELVKVNEELRAHVLAGRAKDVETEGSKTEVRALKEQADEKSDLKTEVRALKQHSTVPAGSQEALLRTALAAVPSGTAPSRTPLHPDAAAPSAKVSSASAATPLPVSAPASAPRPTSGTLRLPGGRSMALRGPLPESTVAAPPAGRFTFTAEPAVAADPVTPVVAGNLFNVPSEGVPATQPRPRRRRPANPLVTRKPGPRNPPPPPPPAPSVQ
ncbi:hypothetical protein MBLNU459_g1682t2 [Dothideomycetes sp. NU459]